MTLPLLLPMAALTAIPLQDGQTAPVVPPAPPPVAAPLPATEQPPHPIAPPSPELADPLTDPATLTSPPEQAPPEQAPSHYPGDPLEGFNRAMFGINQRLDRAVYRPLAMGYQHVVPRPVRSGLRNFFRNLTEPVVFLNDLLQFKFGRAGRTLIRFAFNSTFGIGGLIDVAKTRRIGLPHQDNSFGDTLAYYGVGPGPYLFLPLVGPTTLRDLAGGPVDGAVLPVAVGKVFIRAEYQLGDTLIPGLDLRAESDPELKALFSGAVDPYATLRSVWLQNRTAEIVALHRPRPAAATTPAPELDDPLTDPGAGPTPTPPANDQTKSENP